MKKLLFLFLISISIFSVNVLFAGDSYDSDLYPRKTDDQNQDDQDDRDELDDPFYNQYRFLRPIIGFNQGASTYKNALGLDANAPEPQRIEALQQQEERLKSVATSSSVVKKPEEVGKRNLSSVAALIAAQREETKRLDAEIKKLEAQSNV